MSQSQFIFEEMFQGQTYGPRNGLVPREWQIECLDIYKDSVSAPDLDTQHVFCVYGGTGSGKTKASGIQASYMLNNHLIEQVVVVCPNRSIRNKTKKDFIRYFGIDLVVFNKRKHSDGVPRMKQGYILTYGALLNDPTLHRRLCQSTNTMVIFDEIHHLGDANGWGEKSVEAFGKVSYVIGLTGTPYRSDNTKIPFVRYEETEKNGILRFKADYTYSLGRAVADGVCRKPLFKFDSAKVRIRLGMESGEIVVGFDDIDVSQTIASLRLRGAVGYGSHARRGFLQNALKQCREEKRKVIIFLGGDTEGSETPTQDATTYLPDELRELGYGEDEYEVVTGDDQAAQKKIDEFGSHSKKWILISINMVSEGTDIPEISAAIFLTSITAKQTTVQRIGRAVRLTEETDPHQDALIFMFADNNLEDLAAELDKEIEQEISLKKQSREVNGGPEGPVERKCRAEAIGISYDGTKKIVFHNSEWPANVFEEARQEVRDMGLPNTMLNAALHLMMRGRNGNNS